MMLNLMKRILTGIFLTFAGVTCFLMIFRIPTVLFIIYATLALILVYRIGDRGFVIFIIAFTLIIRLSYIITVNTPLESDFKLLYEAAVQFARGDYSFNDLLYFREWAYQTGFVIYQGIIVRIFGETEAITVLKILNCIWNTVITLLIYLICKNFFGEKPSRLAAVFYSGFVFPVTFVSVLSNQHISTFLILMGVFFIVDRRIIRLRSLPRCIISGLFLALGNILRPEALIVLTSVAAYLFALFLRANEGTRKVAIIGQMLVLLIVYIAVNQGASWAIASSGINPDGLKNNNFYWKFVVGLNYEHRGNYNEEDYKLVYGNSLSQEERKGVEKALISQRLGIGPLRLSNLFMMKMQSLWCDTALDWSYRHMLASNKVVYLLGNPVKFSDIDAVLKDLSELFVFTAMILSFLGMLAMRKNQIDERLLVPVSVLVVSCLVYFFIEVQPRYAYLQHPFLFILSAPGFDMLCSRLNASPLERIWGKIKEKHDD